MQPSSPTGAHGKNKAPKEQERNEFQHFSLLLDSVDGKVLHLWAEHLPRCRQTLRKQNALFLTQGVGRAGRDNNEP